MKKNILVIGNGFDITHSLKTRYDDFIDFIRKNTDIKRTGYIQYLLRYKEAESDWIDIETIIKQINQEIWLFMEEIDKHITEGNMVDLKEELGITKILESFEILCDNNGRLIINPVIYHRERGVRTNKLKMLLADELDKLKRLLTDYLDKEIDTSNIVCKQQIKDINPGFIFTFNYTDTHERYGFNKCHYIHGSLKEKNIVLGYSDDSEHNIFFQKFFQRIEENIEPVRKILKKVCRRKGIFHFYGHSLDPSDGDIIIEMKKYAKKFNIYYYERERGDKNDYRTKLDNLFKLFGRNEVGRMQESGELEFVKITHSCE